MTKEQKTAKFVQLLQSIPDEKWEIGQDHAVVSRFRPYMFVLYQDGTFSVMKRIETARDLLIPVFRAKEDVLVSKYESVCTLLDESEIDAISRALHVD